MINNPTVITAPYRFFQTWAWRMTMGTSCWETWPRVVGCLTPSPSTTPPKLPWNRTWTWMYICQTLMTTPSWMIRSKRFVSKMMRLQYVSGALHCLDRQMFVCILFVLYIIVDKMWMVLRGNTSTVKLQMVSLTCFGLKIGLFMVRQWPHMVWWYWIVTWQRMCCAGCTAVLAFHLHAELKRHQNKYSQTTDGFSYMYLIVSWLVCGPPMTAYSLTHWIVTWQRWLCAGGPAVCAFHLHAETTHRAPQHERHHHSALSW